LPCGDAQVGTVSVGKYNVTVTVTATATVSRKKLTVTITRVSYGGDWQIQYGRYNAADTKQCRNRYTR